MQRQDPQIKKTLALLLAAMLALSGCANVQPKPDGSTAEAESVAEEAPADESAEADKDEKKADKPQDESKGKKGDKKSKDGEEKPSYDSKKAKQLEEHISAACEASGMQVGVSAYDLTCDMPVSVNGDKQFASASMIKLLVASTLLQHVQEGTISLEDTYELQAADIVGGTGWVGSYGVGAPLSYGELMRTMINASDNTSTNALISTLGFDAINAEAERLGLKQTVINRRMMDDAAIAAGLENYTCADDLAVILRKTYDGTLATPDLCETLIKALEEQQDTGGILLGLPQGTVFAHKTGTLAYVRHDGGIVEGEHPYVLVVLCGGDGYYEGGAINTMSQVAGIVHAELATQDNQSDKKDDEAPEASEPQEDSQATTSGDGA